jgi:hypothetical protein
MPILETTVAGARMPAGVRRRVPGGHVRPRPLMTEKMIE